MKEQIPLQIRAEDALAQLIVMVAELKADLQSHMDSEEREKVEQGRMLKRLCEDVEALAAVIPAFPHDEEGNPDFMGHRYDHDTRREDGRSRKKLVQALKEQAAKNIVSGVMALLVMGFVYWQAQAIDKLRGEQPQVPHVTQQQMDALVKALKESK